MTKITEQIFITLADFIGPTQREVLLDLVLYSEEKEFFREKLVHYAQRVASMPQTYEQDGKGDKATAYLHYFTAGMDWYITEKDMGSDGDDAPGQHQAFGLADLGHGEPETGYINLAEALKAGAELDLYFEPKTLGEIKAKMGGN